LQYGVSPYEKKVMATSSGRGRSWFYTSIILLLTTSKVESCACINVQNQQEGGMQEYADFQEIVEEV
jgi:hypothetical protein